MKRANPIYVITTIQFGYKYINNKKSGDGKYHSFEKRTNQTQSKYFTIVRDRTWGWYTKLEYAQDAIKINACDIYEDGYYSHAVIEEMEEGILAYPIKETWYKWKGSIRKGGYKPGRKPREFKNIAGFMDRITQKEKS
jgi:hypothetical protein